MSTPCPICLEHNLKHNSSNQIQRLECERCGNFQIREGVDTVTFQYFRHQSNKSGLNESDYLSNASVKNSKIGKAPERLGKKGSRKRANAAAWLFHQRGRELSFNEIYRLGSVKPPSVTERISLLLKEFALDSGYMGESIDLNNLKYVPVSWSLDTGEYIEIVNHLRKSGYFTRGDNKITTDGWQYLDSIESNRSDSSQVFIAMSFDDNMDSAKNSINKAIDSCGLRPLCLKDIEHVEKIDDKIMYEIRQSRCIVADFTGHKGGVYFEAGYAIGLGVPVIWSCREDDKNDLHFDIRQYNCIFWTNEDDLEKKLSIRLSSIL